MRFPGFIGPSYKLDAYAADVQRSMNLYPEAIESGSGQNAARLVATPGTALFATIAETPARGSYCEPSTGRLFHVAGTRLYEISAAGAATYRGLIFGSGPVTFASNRIELAICGGGQVYTLNLNTNVLTNPTTGGQVVYCGTFFVTFDSDTQQFRTRALGETVWNPLDFASKEGCPDNLVGIFSDHNELWLMGSETCEPWQPTSNPDFPFERLGGSFIEQGMVAGASMAKADNTVFWLGGSGRGGPIAWRANGYAPQRISTHAQEIEWATYPSVSDAIGHAEVWRGHSWWVLTFPSANAGRGATWVYDAATNLWHERGAWDSVHARWGAHVAAYHTVAFGKHLVSGLDSGNIYELSGSYLDDAGAVIRRERVFPHMSSEQVRLFYGNFDILAEKGIGPTPPLYGPDGVTPRSPQIMMQYSNDGGHTWGVEKWQSAGAAGEYRALIRWTRNGQARDRVFRVAMADPVQWSLIDCYVDVEKGIS